MIKTVKPIWFTFPRNKRESFSPKRLNTPFTLRFTQIVFFTFSDCVRTYEPLTKFLSYKSESFTRNWTLIVTMDVGNLSLSGGQFLPTLRGISFRTRYFKYRSLINHVEIERNFQSCIRDHLHGGVHFLQTIRWVLHGPRGFSIHPPPPLLLPFLTTLPLPLFLRLWCCVIKWYVFLGHV